MSLQFLHNPPDPITQIWFGVHSDNVQAFQVVCPTHLLVASCHGHSLYAPSNAMSQLSMIHIQRLHYLFVHEGKSHFPYSAPPHSPNITRALTLQISEALQRKHIGNWAQLLQERTRFLPFDSHPVLRMTRRLSHVHHWRLLVTPPHNLLYVIYHLYLHVAYIGITTMALVSRLRKHMTDALSNQVCSSLHSKMCVTDLSHWGILPLQFVDDDWLASIRERHWWFTYRKYAINDIAPGICADGTGRNTGWLNQKVLALLQGIRDARAIDDFGRVKFLQAQLKELAGELSIPLHTLGQIVVPNCTDDQKTLLHSVIRRMISSSPLTAWEKQALHKSVRVVRSTPYTVQRLIQKPAKQFDASPSRPKCACHRIAHLATHMPDGHCAVIPVQFSLPSGTPVRPKDPLPIPGHEARAAAIKCLQAFGKQIQSTCLTYPS